jgi:transposase
LRVLWGTEVGRVDPERLVFVDEGTHTSLAPLYAYAPVGERAFFKVPRNRGSNTTLLCSLRSEGVGPSTMAVEGATTKEVFEAYAEHYLAPALMPGQIVVMDNLGAHRPKRIRELIESRGCELLYLPPYSPDLNPIEEVFAKVKHILRKLGARTKEALVEAMGRALGSVSVKDIAGYFVHCGYRTPAQLL